MDLQFLFDEPITKLETINKGFSLDKKIIVNDKYVVRIIPLDRITRFKNVLKVQKAFQEVALCQKAYKLETDNKHGYYITEYLQGKNGLEVIQDFDLDTQYNLGIKAAHELVKLHKAFPLPDFDVKTHLDNYLYTKIEVAVKSGVKDLLPEIDEVINVLKHNIHHLYHLKGVQAHADYHLFNMIYDEGIYKGVIDFERVRPGIFLTDFRNNTPHNSPVSPYFASGFIDGYLDKNNIENFFLMYNIYDLLLSIAAIPWVKQFDPENIDKSVKLIRSIFAQRDTLHESPKWYLGKYIVSS
jgi:aminoglycoside phosphotransferase (APT) family kinase protein